MRFASFIFIGVLNPSSSSYFRNILSDAFSGASKLAAKVIPTTKEASSCDQTEFNFSKPETAPPITAKDNQRVLWDFEYGQDLNLFPIRQKTGGDSVGINVFYGPNSKRPQYAGNREIKFFQWNNGKCAKVVVIGSNGESVEVLLSENIPRFQLWGLSSCRGEASANYTVFETLGTGNPKDVSMINAVFPESTSGSKLIASAVDFARIALGKSSTCFSQSTDFVSGKNGVFKSILNGKEVALKPRLALYYKPPNDVDESDLDFDKSYSRRSALINMRKGLKSQSGADEEVEKMKIQYFGYDAADMPKMGIVNDVVVYKGNNPNILKLKNGIHLRSWGECAELVVRLKTRNNKEISVDVLLSRENIDLLATRSDHILWSKPQCAHSASGEYEILTLPVSSSTYKFLWDNISLIANDIDAIAALVVASVDILEIAQGDISKLSLESQSIWKITSLEPVIAEIISLGQGIFSSTALKLVPRIAIVSEN